jgi:hypothetical protein
MSSFKTLAGVNRGLKGGLKNLVPVQELSSPSSISERKDTVVNVMVAVAGKDGDVDKIKEAVFNSHEFTDLRQALVHKTIGFFSLQKVFILPKEQQRALKTPKKTDENKEGYFCALVCANFFVV